MSGMHMKETLGNTLEKCDNFFTKATLALLQLIYIIIPGHIDYVDD